MDTSHVKTGGAIILLHRLQSAMDLLLTISITFGSIWIVGLVVVVVIDVSGRVLFNSPFPGAFEITTFSIIGIVYLQLAHTIRSDRMTRSNLLSSSLGIRFPRVWQRIETVFLILCCGTFLLLTIYVSFRLFNAWENGTYYGSEGAIKFARWPILLIATIGSLMTTIQYLLMALLYAFNATPQQSRFSWNEGKQI